MCKQPQMCWQLNGEAGVGHEGWMDGGAGNSWPRLREGRGEIPLVGQLPALRWA